MKKDSPGVPFPPPFAFVIPFGLGYLAHRYIPWELMPASWVQPLHLPGKILVLAGLLCIVSGMFTFGRAGTAIVPTQAASTLVIRGPYRFTRNPMYLGMTLAYLGGIVLLNTVWTLFGLPIALILVRRFVIAREEAYLTREFGDAYVEYCGKVRRWI